jgi:hypothetical protein
MGRQPSRLTAQRYSKKKPSFHSTVSAKAKPEARSPWAPARYFVTTIRSGRVTMTAWVASWVEAAARAEGARLTR